MISVVAFAFCAVLWLWLEDRRRFDLVGAGVQLPRRSRWNFSWPSWFGFTLITIPKPIADFAQRVKDRLLSQYKTKPKLVALVGELGARVQDVNDALFGMILMFDYQNNAVGVWLDYLGRFVGEARQGAVDDDYRVFIGGRIQANKSNGRIEDLLGVLNQVIALLGGTPTVVVQEFQTATIHFRVEDVVMTDAVRARLVPLMKATKAGGVKLEITYWPIATGANIFQFAAGDVLQLDVLAGFGDDTDPSIGGRFADVDGDRPA